MIWVTFVGEGRSGHTAVSGIVGSHPYARISEEQKYIAKWRRHEYTREQILDAVLSSGKGRYRSEMGFSNLDTFEEPLMVIGDKCGWDAVNEIKNHSGGRITGRSLKSSDLISQFGETMEMPVKVIHTSRHPLDNIASWVTSPKYQRIHGEDTQTRMIRRYSRFYEAAEKVMEGQDIYHLRNEELIYDPEGEIVRLATWLELPIFQPWLRDAVKLIPKTPHRGRDEVEWHERRKREVLGSRIIGRYPSLAYYRED